MDKGTTSGSANVQEIQRGVDEGELHGVDEEETSQSVSLSVCLSACLRVAEDVKMPRVAPGQQATLALDESSDESLQNRNIAKLKL